ncbi:leukosialin [Amia ocellicauda]|uniref:leukosialin n=1 Tax=Amia ocellicauda TaxID=2972642 RepID=UPI00346389BA
MGRVFTYPLLALCLVVVPVLSTGISENTTSFLLHSSSTSPKGTLTPDTSTMSTSTNSSESPYISPMNTTPQTTKLTLAQPETSTMSSTNLETTSISLKPAAIPLEITQMPSFPSSSSPQRTTTLSTTQTTAATQPPSSLVTELKTSTPASSSTASLSTIQAIPETTALPTSASTQPPVTTLASTTLASSTLASTSMDSQATLQLTTSANKTNTPSQSAERNKHVLWMVIIMVLVTAAIVALCVGIGAVINSRRKSRSENLHSAPVKGRRGKGGEDAWAGPVALTEENGAAVEEGKAGAKDGGMEEGEKAHALSTFKRKSRPISSLALEVETVEMKENKPVVGEGETEKEGVKGEKAETQPLLAPPAPSTQGNGQLPPPVPDDSLPPPCPENDPSSLPPPLDSGDAFCLTSAV